MSDFIRAVGLVQSGLMPQNDEKSGFLRVSDVDPMDIMPHLPYVVFMGSCSPRVAFHNHFERVSAELVNAILASRRRLVRGVAETSRLKNGFYPFCRDQSEDF